MIGLLCFVLAVLATPIKSKMGLEAENCPWLRFVTRDAKAMGRCKKAKKEWGGTKPAISAVRRHHSELQVPAAVRCRIDHHLSFDAGDGGRAIVGLKTQPYGLWPRHSSVPYGHRVPDGGLRPTPRLQKLGALHGRLPRYREKWA